MDTSEKNGCSECERLSLHLGHANAEIERKAGEIKEIEAYKSNTRDHLRTMQEQLAAVRVAVKR